MNKIQIKMHYEYPEDYNDTLEEALDISEKQQRIAEESGDTLDLSIYLIMDGTRQGSITILKDSPDWREGKKESEELEQV